MPFPHGFIVVDQNQLRNPDRIAKILDDCYRLGLQILLPDGAFLEFAKGGCFVDTTRRSLTLLSPHRELVVAGRKISDLMADELNLRAPSATLIHEGATAFLRSILTEISRADETALRRLADGPIDELTPVSLDTWNDHERNKRLVLRLYELLKSSLTPDQLKALRRSPKEEVANWLSSVHGSRFVFQGLRHRGADAASAYELTRGPSVTAGFLSALAGLAIYWIAKGGIDCAAASKFSGDLNDLEYVILGALSRSFATDDCRAGLIRDAVAHGFISRRSLPYQRP